MKNYRYIGGIHKVDICLIEYKRKCTCGHTQIVAPASPNKSEWVLCTYCSARLYRDKQKQAAHDKKVAQENFRMKMKEYMKNLDVA